jgi:hypothetical protein
VLSVFSVAGGRRFREAKRDWALRLLGSDASSEEESSSQKIAKITKTIPLINGRRLVPTLHISNGRMALKPVVRKVYSALI